MAHNVYSAGCFVCNVSLLQKMQVESKLKIYQVISGNINLLQDFNPYVMIPVCIFYVYEIGIGFLTIT
ncbi:MAG: hypothetical protein D6737_08490 [Chloroflexi bacterium]|nr:MAG: hypothetical protein D6737_08490 [Chloroflexota bacterium]